MGSLCSWGPQKTAQRAPNFIICRVILLLALILWRETKQWWPSLEVDIRGVNPWKAILVWCNDEGVFSWIIDNANKKLSTSVYLWRFFALLSGAQKSDRGRGYSSLFLTKICTPSHFLVLFKNMNPPTNCPVHSSMVTSQLFGPLIRRWLRSTFLAFS